MVEQNNFERGSVYPFLGQFRMNKTNTKGILLYSRKPCNMAFYENFLILSKHSGSVMTILPLSVSMMFS